MSQLSQTISFPEVSFPVTVWLKKFNKKCNNAKYTGQMKVVLEKIAEVSRDITDKRAGVPFTPKDLEKVTEWEEELPESALTKYFNNWLRIHRTVQASKQAESNVEGGEDENGIENGIENADENGIEDSDEDREKEIIEPKKKKKKLKTNKPEASDKLSTSADKEPKKKKKKKKKELEESNTETKDFTDTGDIVEDIVLSD